jgi:hypothetical protein
VARLGSVRWYSAPTGQRTLVQWYAGHVFSGRSRLVRIYTRPGVCGERPWPSRPVRTGAARRSHSCSIIGLVHPLPQGTGGTARRTAYARAGSRWATLLLLAAPIPGRLAAALASCDLTMLCVCLRSSLQSIPCIPRPVVVVCMGARDLDSVTGPLRPPPLHLPQDIRVVSRMQ